MKKNYMIFSFLIALSLIGFKPVTAQRYVDVVPGIGTLNKAIDGDTTAGGTRVDLNTIYRLQRGNQAYYLLNGSISNSKYPLVIEAAKGNGPRPFLQPNVPDGGESARPFRPKADLTIRGLHVSNQDNLGGYPGRIIRSGADKTRIIIMTVLPVGTWR